MSSSYNAKWQTISVPIPTNYTCTDGSPTGCWVRLEFYYGSGSSPADTTSLDGQRRRGPGPARGVNARSRWGRAARHTGAGAVRHACPARRVVHETMRRRAVNGRHDVLEDWV